MSKRVVLLFLNTETGRWGIGATGPLPELRDLLTWCRANDMRNADSYRLGVR